MIKDRLLQYLEAAIISCILEDFYEEAEHHSPLMPKHFTATMMHQRCANDGFEFLTIEDCTRALNQLASRMFLVEHHDDYADSFYEFNSDNLAMIQDQIARSGTIFAKASAMGRPWLLTAFTKKDGVDLSIDSDEVEQTPKLTYSQFWKYLLIALARVEAAEGPQYRDLGEVAKNAELKYQPGWVRKAANQFDDNGWIRSAFTLGGGEDGGLDAILTGQGLEAAEEFASELGSSATKTNSTDSRTGYFSGAPTESVPASDRLVALDDNSAPYKETMGALETVENLISSNNAYKAEFPEDQERRLTELAAGKQLLRAKQANPHTVKVILGGVLIYLASKFADEPIGDAAKFAWSLLKSLIGL
jgi:hypothetical protein